ncbi:MAG: proton-conducting transporter membrane subunit [Pseudomonadota bacterium]
MWADASALIPEGVLILAALACILARSFMIEQDFQRRSFALSALALAGLAIWIILYAGGSRALFGGILTEDVLSRFCQVCLLLGAAASLAIGVEGGERSMILDPYVAALFLLAVLGLLLIVGASDLIALFLGVQLYVLSSFVLIAQRDNSGRALAAGLGGTFSGFVGTALLLFGAVLVISGAGKSGYGDLADGLSDASGVFASAGLALVIAGLLVSLAIAPFHLWLQPSVEHAPWPVVALMLGVAPMALMTSLARVLFVAFPAFEAIWQPLLSVLGLVSALGGMVAAFGADRISHLLAGLVTLGAGFGLLAISAGTTAGVTGMLALMGLHGIALVGVTAFASMLEKDDRAVDALSDLSGLSQLQMPRVFAVFILLLSFAALPPLAGFMIRVNIVQAVYNSGMIWQAMAGLGVTALAAFAILRPAWRLYMVADTRDVEVRAARLPDLVLTVTALAALLTLVSLAGLEAVIEAAAARLVR